MENNLYYENQFFSDYFFRCQHCGSWDRHPDAATESEKFCPGEY
jgi:hypothetical protein